MNKDWFLVLGFISGVLIGVFALNVIKKNNAASSSQKTEQVVEQVVEQTPAIKDQLPEQIELLCIKDKLFVRDHFGDGSLVQVAAGGSNSVLCD